MLHPLAQVKLEDVFKSTQQSMSQPVGGDKLLALVLVVVGLLVLLVLLNYRRAHRAAPRGLNHRGKLLREVGKAVTIKGAEMRQLKKMADEQGCSSPLVLLLCPSVLAKGLAGKSKEERKALSALVQRGR